MNDDVLNTVAVLLSLAGGVAVTLLTQVFQ
jgi:hypothetical protein